MPLLRLLRMFACVSGTALGAFSEPLVKSTTASLIGRHLGSATDDETRKVTYRQQGSQGFPFANPLMRSSTYRSRHGRIEARFGLRLKTAPL